MKKIFLISLVLVTTLFFRPKTILAGTIAPPITKKVMLLIFNPILESQGNTKLTQFLNWNDPDNLTQQYIQDVKTVSGGIVNYQIAKRLEVDGFPIKADGFKYSDETYLECWRDHSKCHGPDSVDYYKILSDYDVCAKRNLDEINELWIFGGPWFGYWEAVMAGPGAFWTNASPLYNTTCQKQLHIMGFSYERGVSEMLENLGHRVEGTMAYVYGEEPRWSHSTNTAWGNFVATCGWMHYAPNSDSNYDWGNQKTVASSCEDWLNYPSLTGAVESFNCSRWNCDGYQYKKWWLSHLPNNWWRYVLDYEEAAKTVNISDLRSLLQNFTNIFDYNILVGSYGQ